MNWGLFLSNLMLLMVHSLRRWHPTMTHCWVLVACESVKIVKIFLNLVLFIGMGLVDKMSCTFVVGLTRTREDSYLSSSSRKDLMLVAGLNFSLAWGGGK